MQNCRGQNLLHDIVQVLILGIGLKNAKNGIRSARLRFDQVQHSCRTCNHGNMVSS